MKILYIRSSVPYYESRVLKEIDALCSDGHSVTFLGLNRRNDLERPLELDSGKVPVVLIGSKEKRGSVGDKLQRVFGFQVSILKYLNKFGKNYDCIHACDFDCALAAFLYSKYSGIPYVYDIFDYYADAHCMPKAVDLMVRKVDKTVIENAKSVIICTEKRREQLGKAKARKVTVVYNTPDAAGFNFSKSDIVKCDGTLKVAYIGALTNERFIREIIDVVKDRPWISLYLGGAGDEMIVQYAQRISGECDRIHFLGRQTYTNVLAIENACDILIAMYNPAIRNHVFAAPNKFYEAVMLGKPIIMARNTGLDDLVEKYGIGIVVPYSTDGLSDGLEKLNSQKATFPALENKMKDLYVNEFSWASSKQRLLSLYCEDTNAVKPRRTKI